MKNILILVAALAASAVSYAAGWDYFNPKYAGTAQIRTGVSFDHESESASQYVNARFVIKEDAEISIKTTDGTVDMVGVKYDILDKGAIAVELKDTTATVAAQVYKDFDKFSVGTELSYNVGETFQFGAEIDTYFLGHVQYAGFTFDSEAIWSPYFGYVYTTDKVDLGATYFLVMDKTYYLTSGWSFDLTFKF